MRGFTRIYSAQKYNMNDMIYIYVCTYVCLYVEYMCMIVYACVYIDCAGHVSIRVNY